MAASLSNLHTATSARREPRMQPLVLLTDDDEDTRLLLRTVLDMHGCSVIEATDGEKAVVLAQSAQPDLILMDGSLPRLDGLAATRRIRQLGHVPIIFVSGHAEPAFRAVALEAGCDEYIVKPFDLIELGDVVEKYLGTNNKRTLATGI